MTVSPAQFKEDIEKFAGKNPKWTLEQRKDAIGHPLHFLIGRSCLTTSTTDSDQRDDELSDETAPRCDLVILTLYITYSVAFQVPQIHFSAVHSRSGALCTLREIETLLPYVNVPTDPSKPFTNTAGIIVSPSFCEELGLPLYSVHQCDTADMLRICDELGVTSEQCVTERLLCLFGPMLGLESLSCRAASVNHCS